MIFEFFSYLITIFEFFFCFITVTDSHIDHFIKIFHGGIYLEILIV